MEDLSTVCAPGLESIVAQELKELGLGPGPSFPGSLRDIYRANSFLLEPARVFSREGRTIVIIRPDEKLAGLDRFGIVPTPAPETAPSA